MEIGDRFIIKVDKTWGRGNLCKTPLKEFTIKKFSNSGLSIYFDDLRTNHYCLCSFCLNYSFDKGQRCIGVSEIKITQTRKQYERNLKLKQIL